MDVRPNRCLLSLKPLRVSASGWDPGVSLKVTDRASDQQVRPVKGFCLVWPVGEAVWRWKAESSNQKGENTGCPFQAAVIYISSMEAWYIALICFPSVLICFLSFKPKRNYLKGSRGTEEPLVGPQHCPKRLRSAQWRGTVTGLQACQFCPQEAWSPQHSATGQTQESLDRGAAQSLPRAPRLTGRPHSSALQQCPPPPPGLNQPHGRGPHGPKSSAGAAAPEAACEHTLQTPLHHCLGSANPPEAFLYFCERFITWQ